MQKLLIFFIKLYQKVLSPHLGGNCRFYPSCSDYALQTVHKHGAFRGFLKTLWRIARCNPFCKGGFDYP